MKLKINCVLCQRAFLVLGMNRMRAYEEQEYEYENPVFHGRLSYLELKKRGQDQPVLPTRKLESVEILLASVYVLDTVALILEGAAVRAREGLPTIVFALIGIGRWIASVDLYRRLKSGPATGTWIEPERSDSARAAVAVVSGGLTVEVSIIRRGV